MNRFGNYLYSLRKAKGMTQAELADLLGITNKAVSKWETGEAFPETSQLVPLADVFGVAVDDLLRGGPAERREAEEKPLPQREAPASERGDGAPCAARSFRPESWNIAFALLLGAGVLLALAGIAALVVARCFWEGERSLLPFIVLLLAAFTLAADLFTAAGILHERYFLPVRDGAWKARVRAFVSFMLAGITAGGAGLCVLACSGMFSETQGMAAFVACVCGGLALFAVAAFFFIFGGIVWDGYCKKTCAEEDEEVVRLLEEHRWEKNSLTEKLCAAIMIVATAVFLLCGFLWELWGKAWVAFVVGGLLCGIVSVWTEKKGK